MKVSDKDMEEWYGDRKVAKEMQGDQLEKAYHFGLQYIDLSNCNIYNSSFKMKNLQKENDPKWPAFMHFLASPELEIVNMSNCKLTKQDGEFLTYALNENPIAASKVKNLNLMKNSQVSKEGFKIFFSLLEKSKKLENLDLSGCKLGVSGMASLCAALEKNTSIKTLNLYRNIIDIDGARALKKVLEKNNSLEFLDLSFNRLREKGIIAITDGMKAN